MSSQLVRALWPVSDRATQVTEGLQDRGVYVVLLREAALYN
jgi:hypothetical protein